ncbi:hypothetical protein C8R47DRAFT_1198564 [Mycena vitilis]|nr:hypothetical protein C8R47DRAFT_1198564 [Mycena vitilis]
MSGDEAQLPGEAQKQPQARNGFALARWDAVSGRQPGCRQRVACGCPRKPGPAFGYSRATKATLNVVEKSNCRWAEYPNRLRSARCGPKRVGYSHQSERLAILPFTFISFVLAVADPAAGLSVSTGLDVFRIDPRLVVRVHKWAARSSIGSSTSHAAADADDGPKILAMAWTVLFLVVSRDFRQTTMAIPHNYRILIKALPTLGLWQ